MTDGLNLAPLSPFQFSLNGLPDELGTAFAVIQNGVDPDQRSFGESGRGSLVVDLLPTHARKIDDITNCFKPYFSLAPGGIDDIIFASERETDVTSNYEVAIKAEAKRVVRCFHQYSSEHRANHAASHRMGYRQRRAEGQFFYMHPDFPNKGFPTRGAAARAALGELV